MLITGPPRSALSATRECTAVITRKRGEDWPQGRRDRGREGGREGEGSADRGKEGEGEGGAGRGGRKESHEMTLKVQRGACMRVISVGVDWGRGKREKRRALKNTEKIRKDERQVEGEKGGKRWGKRKRG